MPRLIALFALVAAAFTLSADPGDDILKKLTIPPAPPLTPAEALKSFKIADGFKIEVAASDPLIQDPIAMSFDADGRLYVCELRGYMPDIDGKGENAPVGRISLLEDKDNDGVYESATVFLDKLVSPRAVMAYGGGALVGEGGKLWHCRSTKNDGICDDKTFVCDYPMSGNPEYGANSPTYGLDNWIYSALHGIRLRKIKGEWVKESTTSRGQYGLTSDDAGRLYYNSNSSLLRGDLSPVYSPSVHLASSQTNAQLYKEQDVYPSRVTPGINRYYMLRPDGTLKAVTAACGPVIYRGDLIPALKGDAVICEPSANLVRRNILFEEKGKRTSKNAYDKAEFLTSTDERFRPVAAANGPDGALYLVDLYRGILQHKAFLQPFLKGQIIDRKLDVPIHLGRVYRIVPENGARKPVMKLSTKSNEELVPLLAHPNGWTRDTAQRLLVERNDPKSAAAIEAFLGETKEPLGKLHALWTLEGLGQLDPDAIASVLGDADPQVRRSAVALCGRFVRAPFSPDLLRELAARSDDPSVDVRTQLVHSLGLVNHPLAEKAIEPTLKAAASDAALLDGILSGFAGRETEFLAARLDQPAWKTKEPWREKLLIAAAVSLAKQKHPLSYLRLFHLVAAQPDDASWQQLALLKGAGAMPVKAKETPRPIRLPTPSDGLAKLLASTDPAVKTAAQGLAEKFVWPGKDGKPLPVPPPLTETQQTLNDLGKKEYVAICASCHHPIGYGVAGSGPPLVDSDWLRGPDERLIRMMLHGLRDPISINKEAFNKDGSLSMPAMGMALDDAKIAGVLTFVRREWGDFAAPVSVETVSRVRAATKTRQEPWTERELVKIK